MASLRHPPPSPLCAFVAVKKSFLSQRKHLLLTLRGAVLTAKENRTSDSLVWSVCLIDTIVKGKDKGRSISVIDKKVTFVRLFFDNDGDYGLWLETLARASTWKLQNFYDLEEELGQGQFARVRKGYEKLTREPVAVKVVRKRHPNLKVLDFVEREYEIMTVLDHPNIIKTYDVFDEPDKLYIVLEFMAGGQLFDVIQEERFFSEKNASQVMRDVLRGLEYLHAKNIVHRDIKPENILCKTTEFPLEVKIADFGLANFIDSESTTSATERIGTPMYIAPEIVQQKKHGRPVDMWACGVLLYIMLSGRFPFMADSSQLVMKKVVKGIFSFPESSWRFVSIDAKMLIRSLLNVNPEDRMTAELALQHRWLIRADRLSNMNITEHILSFRKSISNGKQNAGKQINSWSMERTKSLSGYYEEPDGFTQNGRPSTRSLNSVKTRGSRSFMTRAEADLEDIHRSSHSTSINFSDSRGFIFDGTEEDISLRSHFRNQSWMSGRNSHFSPERELLPQERLKRKRWRSTGGRRDLFRSMGL